MQMGDVMLYTASKQEEATRLQEYPNTNGNCTMVLFKKKHPQDLQSPKKCLRPQVAKWQVLQKFPQRDRPKIAEFQIFWGAESIIEAFSHFQDRSVSGR